MGGGGQRDFAGWFDDKSLVRRDCYGGQGRAGWRVEWGAAGDPVAQELERFAFRSEFLSSFVVGEGSWFAQQPTGGRLIEAEVSSVPAGGQSGVIFFGRLSAQGEF